jgi:hypothetical protein
MYPDSISLPIGLGDGLILRRGAAADADRLAAFNLRIHSDNPAEPQMGLDFWTRDLLSGRHPTICPEDFTVVEDMASGQVVSTLCLIPQTWSYEGIPLAVGRPELVGTDPDFRNRGLVRRQFEVIHAWSQARGELMQAITGIPYYYRQFGYEMGLELGGMHSGYLSSAVKDLAEGEVEAVVFRPAGEADLAWIAECYRRGYQRYPLSAVRDEALWRYELIGRNPRNENGICFFIIQTAEGKQIGFLGVPSEPRYGGKVIACTLLEMESGVNWQQIAPGLLRFLRAEGEKVATTLNRTCEQVGFSLGSSHPVYEVLKDKLPLERKPYAYYVRVPDLATFLLHIAPGLDKRLGASVVAGFEGELRFSFYKRGLRLKFVQGHLDAVEEYRPTSWSDADAAFPDQVFLQLLFGYRSLDELCYAFADCWVNGQARLVLDTLFPKKPSLVWPVS